MLKYIKLLFSLHIFRYFLFNNFIYIYIFFLIYIIKKKILLRKLKKKKIDNI